MTAAPSLTRELRGVVDWLVDDLRERLPGDPDRASQWRDEHREAVAAHRSAAGWSEFVDERLTQAAVGWVLMTVFVRFCEDNDLLAPTWLTGPGRRREYALEAQQQFIAETVRTNPDVTDREWLQQAVDYLADNPATALLVDSASPLRLIAPSGDAATRVIAFWRDRDEQGALRRDLADPAWDTRFLGDLYQDLSEWAKKQYALLQTPVFVEEFILDRTLEPALRERPLEGFRLIDPTCGSGHFLLGAFARLLDRWQGQAPALDERVRVQHALDSINGVDLNPFAVAITRFRLTVAAVKASGDTRLDGETPAFTFHLAVGDSLLHGLDQSQLGFGTDYALHAGHDRAAEQFTYATENYPALQRILANGSYDCVVGNPPYITVRDKALNAEYRRHYKSCKGKYALTVPFAERFFSLAKTGERAGWVGQITSNSFMKREFGSKLIEDFFPRVDLRLVADTSGAYIPGHGTPTVILVGRNTRPQTATVRAVLGVRGEPGQPADPSKGLVWTSLTEHVDQLGWSDEWITVTDLDRSRLAQHPWSLTGGGAVELLREIEQPPSATLQSRTSEIGIGVVVGEEEGFEVRPSDGEPTIPLVTGDLVRDFGLAAHPIFWPYDLDLRISSRAAEEQGRWPYRTSLANYLWFGKTRSERGMHWLEYGTVARSKFSVPMSIAFAFVATHNHFVLDRGGKVFKQTAPVIKLPESAREDDHLALLGVLNSSTASFWVKQNSFDRGNGGIGGGIASEDWERFYEFTATTLQDFPLPAQLEAARGQRLDDLAQERAAHTPVAVAAAATPTRERLSAAHVEYDRQTSAMIAEQEELDWDTYHRYGLVDDDLTYPGELPGLELGQRAFEIALARRVAAGEESTAWFTRHRSTPITELPADWPADYQDLVRRRIEVGTRHPYLRLLEKPEHKRRWSSEPWQVVEERALRGWLLHRLEDRRFWYRGDVPTPRSVANLADAVRRDAELLGVLQLWVGRPDERETESLLRLLATESVPYLAAYRYTEPGLRKRAEWEHVWDLQRAEDRSGRTDPTIPVPPKYQKTDFRRGEYWTHRGKLDVAKERFIGYPGAERGADPTPVLGWAGWDHAERAVALAGLAQQAAGDGAEPAKRIPLVAGLVELQPWLDQWHAAADNYGQSPAEDIATFTDSQAADLEHTRDQLAAWRPPAPTRRRRG